MSISPNTGLSFLSEYFSLNSILTAFDLSALPEFAAVALTVLAGLGAGVLSMLVVLILMDLVGDRLDWWDNNFSLEKWLHPPLSGPAMDT